VLPGEDIIIVDPETRTQLSPGSVGEIWISSGSVGQGYWNKPEITNEIFRARLADSASGHYLRSGDLGFLHERELFVTGRVKDLIIVRGVNRYPQDIEMTVERADRRLRNGAAAAFAVEIDNQERLVVVSEVERGIRDDWDEVIDAIRRDVTMEHELPPDGVILVRAGSIPKTSSGKIQRHACRHGFLNNSLLTVARRCAWEPDQPAATRRASAAVPARDRTSRQAEALVAVIKHVRSVAESRAEVVRADTNIVDLGLDSLERLEIVNGLESEFGGRLPQDVLPQIVTCGQVAEAVAQYLMSAPAGPERDIPAGHYQFDRMTEYLQLQRKLELLKPAGLTNPYFRRYDEVHPDTAVIEGQRRTSFASQDYLGLSGDPAVLASAQAAMRRDGAGVSNSRLAGGQRAIHQELEQALAAFLQVDSALVFVDGYGTNQTTIGHLAGPGDLVLHDALAHNSILQGATLSGARRRPFPHHDWQALDQLLAESRRDYRRVLVIIEGVSHVDGDLPDLREFIRVKQRHRVFLAVDESHSLGTLGPHGRGLCEQYGTDPRDVDVRLGSLNHALGSTGGYVAGCQALTEYLQYTAPGFVHNAGLAPSAAGAALAALQRLQFEPWRARRCRERSALLVERAREAGLNTGRSQGSPIVPLIVGKSVSTLKLSRALFDRGFDVPALVYPAIEESAARLRFFVTAWHTEEQVEAAVRIAADQLAAIAPSSLQRRRSAAPAPPPAGRLAAATLSPPG
jgi:acyl carrier protein